MEELKTILCEHASRYPAMEPGDAVKLIFQNEFGGGHLISDPQACIRYLHREYHGVDHSQPVPAWEDIGNGIVRVNLAALPAERIDLLADAFIRSACAHKGSMEQFLAKLTVLRDLAGQGIFSFSVAQLQDYLLEYAALGCPAVSHSQTYRNAYHPAYRVVRKEFLKDLI